LEIEICRFVFTQETNENSWWEARQPTADGDKTIYHGPTYIDEHWKSQNTWGGALASSFGFVNLEEAQRKSEEQRKAANVYVVAQLGALEWEPTGTDQDGLVSVMKHVKS
jgi:hypothetical protein